MRRTPALTASTALLALAACGTHHDTGDRKPPSPVSPAIAAYTAGYEAGTDALKTGNAKAVMKGDQAHAVEGCEGVVAVYYNNGNGTTPPGFTIARKQSWYAGCQDALQGLDADVGHATSTPAPVGG
jgi:hypothetical protein